MIITSTAKMSLRHQQNLMDQFSEHQFYFFDNMKKTDPDRLSQSEILLTYGEDLTESIINQMPKLKWIQVLSAGLELMPFQCLQARGILVTNARGIHKIPMAEYTMAMILEITRKNRELYDLQKKSFWDRTIRVDEVYGLTLGIVGLGSIGEEIAKRAKVFGMKVIGIKREAAEPNEHVDEILQMKDLPYLLNQSDFVVVLLPTTPETAKCIGANELSMMKSTAYFINMARGAIVDEQALLEVLREKKIAGAVLDVFEQEPLPEEHPFWQLDNVRITPHLSGRSPHYMKRALDIFEANLKKYPHTSQMKNVIDLAKGY